MQFTIQEDDSCLDYHMIIQSMWLDNHTQHLLGNKTKVIDNSNTVTPLSFNANNAALLQTIKTHNWFYKGG